MNKKRIYAAGAMSSSDPIKFLDNLRKGMRVSTELLLNGYAVFSPFWDFNAFFQCREGECIPIDMIQAQSLAWLEVSDAILLVPGWESSKGTLRELDRAQMLGIPVFHSLGELDAYFKLERMDNDKRMPMAGCSSVCPPYGFPCTQAQCDRVRGKQ